MQLRDGTEGHPTRLDSPRSVQGPRVNVPPSIRSGYSKGCPALLRCDLSACSLSAAVHIVQCSSLMGPGEPSGPTSSFYRRGNSGTGLLKVTQGEEEPDSGPEYQDYWSRAQESLSRVEGGPSHSRLSSGSKKERCGEGSPDPPVRPTPNTPRGVETGNCRWSWASAGPALAQPPQQTKGFPGSSRIQAGICGFLP